MSIEDNVTVVKSLGDECFICEKTISAGEKAIQVQVKVSVVLATVPVKRLAHVNCAESLQALLYLRIGEARSK